MEENVHRCQVELEVVADGVISAPTLKKVRLFPATQFLVSTAYPPRIPDLLEGLSLTIIIDKKNHSCFTLSHGQSRLCALGGSTGIPIYTQL